MENLYDVLGVKRGATDGEIKRAYRKRARKAHPDAGGNTDEFKLVGFAGMILCDPAKREHYDRTGQERAPTNVVEQRIASLLGQAFEQDGRDPIRAMCDYIDQKRSAHKQHVAKAESKGKRLAIKLKKFLGANSRTKNAAARDFIASNLEKHIEDCRMEAGAAANEAEICTAMLAYLNDLQCPAEPGSHGFTRRSSTVTFGGSTFGFGTGATT